MQKKLFMLFILVGIAFTTVVTGCSSSKVETETSKLTNREELILAVGSEPETGFDPTLGWGRYGSPLFQSTILKRNHDLEIVHDLAEDYAVSADGKVWTVQLRKDVTFSDGQPLTATDVQYTFETAANSGSVLDLHNLEKVEAIDQHTVAFTLKTAQSTFIHSLVSTGIVPKHAHGPNYAEQPIGSGPYTLVQWDKGQQLIVQLNPKYYGVQSPFKKITFLFLNEDAAFAAAQAGNVDVAYIPASFSKQGVPGMRLEAVHTVDNRGIMFPFAESGEKTKDGFPIGNDVTADPAIRKAINLAVDRQAIVDGVLEGYGTPAYTVVDGMPWWNPETVMKDGNMEEAKRILSEAGWKDENGDGLLEKGSLKAEFPLVYPASDAIRQSLAITVADMMKPLGINMIVEGKSWDDIRSMMHSSAVLYGWGSHDPLEMYNLYSSNYAGVDLYNPGYYHNPCP